MIRVQCTSCGKRFKIADERAGQSGPCPACEAPLTIPAAGDVITADDSEEFDPMQVLGEPDEPAEAVASTSVPEEATPPDQAPAPKAQPADNRDESPAPAAGTAASAAAAMDDMNTAPLRQVSGSRSPKSTGPSLTERVSEAFSGESLREVLKRPLFAVFAGLVLIAGIFYMPKGCSDDRIVVYKTRGRVLFPNGSPVRTGTIELESTIHGTTSTGRINQDGTFVLGTYTPNDGAPAGPHRVIVVQMVIRDGTFDHTLDHGLPVDPRCGSYETSGIKVDVEAKEQNELTVQVRTTPRQ